MSDDLANPEIYTDPYPLYARLLAERALFRSDEADGWFALVYHDVRFLLKDAPVSSRLTSSGLARMPASLRETLAPLFENFDRWCVLLDAPEHTRLRGLLNHAFSARLINKLTVDINLAVNELINKAIKAKGGELDLVGDFAHPLPLVVLGKMLGVHGAEEELKSWSDAIASFFGLHLNFKMIRHALTCMEEAYQCFRSLCDERRRRPEEDLLTAFVTAEAAGQVDEAEILAMCTLLIFAGHETTTNLVANSMLALLREPGQMTVLRSNPDMMETAVEELLRYDSPLQRVTRLATEDLDIRGVKIPKGERIYMVVGAANRNPAVFSQPDVLKLDRSPNPHLAFGHGRHFCSGAALTRLEGRIAIETLLRRLPGLRLGATPPEWHRSVMLRGLRSLSVSFWPTGAWAGALAH